MEIIKVTIEELNQVSNLFDKYRQFYKQDADLPAATTFIKERLVNEDSVIYLALVNNQSVGFTQLYPAFSSVAMKRMWYLNDLYVHPDYRKQGIAEALLEQAQQLAIETNALTVKLATAVDNNAAKALYEKVGYQKITAFEHYSRKVW
ncbi:GNAT family N-acetyltransferase [Endozoicomonas sp. SM1973]|uniref:GNAT family N-acetyltransferase n=1 Tax=Spartinivicinus marinus TaxID=2994442 RepID=A0A853I6Q0_9GAMM|nr:GNAT family N-acetyltransferase [Spartinivicinus marinus]MCX4027337.1 GNAT family N-acetyltransferase [Spartinivicinus marinus]NYZ68439.1 GNAT family N-acetyltransferase [Spartinivicinus marinus]